MRTPIEFVVAPGGSEPIYRSLVEQLRRRVAAGEWTAGQELPSVRQVAVKLAVNPMTVSKAYSVMDSEGLVERRRGLPMVIARRFEGAAPQEERLKQLRPLLAPAAAAALELEIPREAALGVFAEQMARAPALRS